MQPSTKPAHQPLISIAARLLIEIDPAEGSPMPKVDLLRWVDLTHSMEGATNDRYLRIPAEDRSRRHIADRDGGYRGESRRSGPPTV
jgi:hypothetical protein